MSSSPVVCGKCDSFQPHHLRPNKCRSCFGDIEQHANGSNSGARPQLEGVTTTRISNNTTNDQTTTMASKRQDSSSEPERCQGCLRAAGEIDALRRELQEWQTRCGTAEAAEVKARDELRVLESEMEEMQDNFKEEESEQFEQLKQELDAALKNCKILQIRLNKSERQYGQLEQVKLMLEKQLGERQQEHQITNPDHGRRLAGPNVGGGGGDAAAAAHLYELSGDFVKVPTGEYDQLLRDLNDTSERERDLQEQIKYSQEEAQLKGERLQAIEAENEVLLGRINKLTLANSSLRSNLMSTSSSGSLRVGETGQGGGGDGGGGGHQTAGSQAASSSADQSQEKMRNLCEQNEQLKLALEVVQAECQRVKGRVGELQQTLEMKERSLQELESKLDKADQLRRLGEAPAQDSSGSPMGRYELECRQLRARLAHSERECRQLRSQLEMMSTTRGGGGGSHVGRNQTDSTTTSPAGQGRRLASNSSLRSQSMELPSVAAATGCSASSKCHETIDQLDRQCRGLSERNQQLETKLQRFIEFSNQDLDQKTHMESELFEKLKRQLEASENELAKSKSRLVELDIECGRAQRQHKRLLGSLESCGSLGGELISLRRHRLPQDEAGREAMSRQELRQAWRDLELDVDDLIAIVKAKEVLIKEQRQQSSATSSPSNIAAPETSSDNQQAKQPPSDQASEQQQQQQARSLRRLLDQEQLLSNNLKLDVASLERDNAELAARTQMLERERVAMEEELDKLRQLSGEFRAELEESEREKALASSKARELNEMVERLRCELNHARQSATSSTNQTLSTTNTSAAAAAAALTKQAPPTQEQTEALLMARDLSELKVKNGFLMRQLEIARDDTASQLEELRQSGEAQLRRAVELAQLEMRERHLHETQQLRDELQDGKQKLTVQQRQTSRHEEELAQERDRARAIERDWRRDKSQWQQSREQLEGQLTIERRSNEFRLKEAEAAIRDKERQLLNMQDRCVQLERDLKRLQNKFHLLEEDSESKTKQLTRDLEMRTKELNELVSSRQSRDEQQFEMLKRLQDEKATLRETLDTLRRSYDEKLSEARQLRDVLQSRQEQAYKERAQQIERLEAMTRRLNEMGEFETQAKLLKQRLEMQERQLESNRRDLVQLRDERVKLRSRCDELEKRELITKTSSISGASSSSFFKPFGSPRSQLLGSARSQPASGEPNQVVGVVSTPTTHSKTPSMRAANQSLESSGSSTATGGSGGGGGGATSEQQSLVERLSGKINDQRNLINILRQQLNETQMELKQLKLLQSSERSKWQARLALTSGRLNECEEKLAYETALLNKSSALIEQLARPRLELNWAQERQVNLELIQQQQGQIELLAKDLRKTSQAHDLLRLQSKQLESQNHKLSRKLIEYQQQSSIFSLQDRELERNYDKLVRKNAQLTHETRPLLEIVGKIIASLDAPEQQQQPQQQQVGAKLESTDRPLRAGSLAARAERALDSDDSGQLELELSATGRPAHQLAAATPSSSPSRLTRLLAGGTKAHSMPNDDNSQAGNSRFAAKKTVKRVRVKCSTLGITTSEKKLLKQHLKSLSEALNDQKRPTDSMTTTTATTSKPERSALGLRNQQQHSDAAAAAGETKLATRASGDRSRLLNADTDQSSQQSSSHTSRVHWQIDSDLESESSWSLAGGGGTGGDAQLSPAGGRQDLYRRFPQASPGTAPRAHSLGPAGASLTDYESESSLASDYSVSTFSPLSGRRPGAPSGAESDSGLASGAKLTPSGRKLKPSGGLKGRLTSTLRNISRSITGGLGGSDTEETPSSYEKRQRHNLLNDPASAGQRKQADLKEIRV